MIAFLPHCGFLSEVSRAIAIATALRERGVAVMFGARGGPYAHLIAAAGFTCESLAPTQDDARARRFLDALLSMGGADLPFYDDAELREAVASEVTFLKAHGARLAVTGFTLTAYLSTRVAGIPLATEHGGAFVPPVLQRGLAPVPVNPVDPGMLKLPRCVQKRLANVVPTLLTRPVAQLNAHAQQLGVPPIPNLLALMCGDLTLVTELPEVLGIPRESIEQWRPRWPYRVRPGARFRCTGPLFARLDLPIPPAVEAFLSQGGPLVYLSPTSVDDALLRALVRRSQATGARVLVGSTVHRIDDLNDERTLVAGVLPNHLVFPRVQAGVIMGGQGSVQTAIASGVPFVGLPWHGEQELNVAVAERLGVALRVSPRQADSEHLTDALRMVLNTPSFATRAREARALYAGVDGAARAAAAIEGYLAEGAHRIAPGAPTAAIGAE